VIYEEPRKWAILIGVNHHHESFDPLRWTVEDAIGASFKNGENASEYWNLNLMTLFLRPVILASGVVAATTVLLACAGVPILQAAFLGINTASLGAFGYDKRQAQVGGWRVPEAVLLLQAALGGTPGAFLGMVLFRHKTSARRFQCILVFIAFLQVLALLGLKRLRNG
jgi:uncharacterized membrane protein YsdA (DUF1294 family)